MYAIRSYYAAWIFTGSPAWRMRVQQSMDLPPNSEIRKPAIIAVNNPFSGETPEAIAKAIARGNATIAIVNPANKSFLRFS